MTELIFFWGKNDYLSLLELLAYAKGHGFFVNVKAHHEKAALIELDDAIAVDSLMRDLAGTVKIGKIIAQDTAMKTLLQKKELSELVEDFPKKGTYSLGEYSVKENRNRLDLLREFLRDDLKRVKSRCTFKWPKSYNIEHKLQTFAKDMDRNKEHVDVNVVSFGTQLYITKTICFKRPDDWIKRDEGRAIQKSILTTSLRLANMMLNLSESKKGQTVLDPFCGIGTILQEALVQGKNAVGVDVDLDHAEAAEKNTALVKKIYHLNSNCKVYSHDSQQLKTVLREKFDCVVTEPYLGPYLRNRPAKHHAQAIMHDLERLYRNVFSQLGSLMHKGQIVVIILPQIPHQGHGTISTSEKVFLDAGFVKHDLLSSIKPSFLPYLYKDVDNKIERLIYVLEKQ